MLDAPVSGSTPVAAAGELTIMVGGDEQTFEEFEPVLAAMGEKISRAAQEREPDLGLLPAAVQALARAKGPLLRPGVGTRSRGSSAHNRSGLPDLQRWDEGARGRRHERGGGGLPPEG